MNKKLLTAIFAIGLFATGISGCSSSTIGEADFQSAVWPTFKRTGEDSDSAALEGKLIVENGCVKVASESSGEVVTAIFADDLAINEYLTEQPEVTLGGGFINNTSTESYDWPNQCGEAETVFITHEISPTS